MAFHRGPDAGRAVQPVHALGAFLYQRPAELSAAEGAGKPDCIEGNGLWIRWDFNWQLHTKVCPFAELYALGQLLCYQDQQCPHHLPFPQNS